MYIHRTYSSSKLRSMRGNDRYHYYLSLHLIDLTFELLPPFTIAISLYFICKICLLCVIIEASHFSLQFVGNFISYFFSILYIYITPFQFDVTLLHFLEPYIYENMRDLYHRGWILEAKTDCSAKDRRFFASFAFCVITFEPIMI
jgi:hypothetical protein